MLEPRGERRGGWPWGRPPTCPTAPPFGPAPTLQIEPLRSARYRSFWRGIAAAAGSTIRGTTVWRARKPWVQLTMTVAPLFGVWLVAPSMAAATPGRVASSGTPTCRPAVPATSSVHREIADWLSHISQNFNPPVEWGFDIAMPYQTPVYAVESGQVIALNADFGAGGVVSLEVRPGLSEYYQHLSAMTVHLHQRVLAGSLLGYSGGQYRSTGACTPVTVSAWSSGPHLEFGINPPGRSGGWFGLGVLRDPVPYLRELVAHSVEDGEFLLHEGTVYRLVGGAPLPVSCWGAVGGRAPLHLLSDTAFRALSPTPRAGTRFEARSCAGGVVSTVVVAGGAAFSVPDDRRAHPAALPVDAWVLRHAGMATAHLQVVAQAGTLVRGEPSGVCWQLAIRGRQPQPTTSCGPEVADSALAKYPIASPPTTTSTVPPTTTTTTPSVVGG